MAEKGVRVFISQHSGNQKIATEQARVLRVLESRSLPYCIVDISAPGSQGLKSFMRERGRKQEGERHVLPPQIFNGEEYRGDYDAFDLANEDDVLEEFLGLERRYAKVNPIKTGAQAREVGRLEVGRLTLPEKKAQPPRQVRKKSFAVEASCEEPISQEVEELKEPTNQILAVKPTVIDWKDLKISRVKISFAKFVLNEREEKVGDEETTDSDEDSDSELFEDGERRRKTSRGFKLLNNCRRFWQASQSLGLPNESYKSRYVEAYRRRDA